MTPNRVAEIIEAAFAEGFGAGLVAALEDDNYKKLGACHDEFWSRSAAKRLYDTLALSQPAEGSA